MTVAGQKKATPEREEFNMGNKMVGYARVSSLSQCEDRQIIELRAFGVEEKYIFLDKQSGKDFERPGYRRMLRVLRKGDTLVIPSIDRMGRDYRMILNEWRELTQERHVQIVVLDMPLLDTREEKDLSGMFIADMLLQMMSYTSNLERKHIRERQAAGIRAAKARGVHMGRPSKPKPERYAEVVQLYREGRISGRKAATELGVSQTCFRNWLNREQKEDV